MVRQTTASVGVRRHHAAPVPRNPLLAGSTGGSRASSGHCYLFLAAQQVAVLGEQGSIGSTAWGGGLPNSDCASSSLPHHRPGQLSTNPTATTSDANTPRLYSNQTCEYLPECFKIDPMIHCRSAVETNLDGNGDFMVDYVTWFLLLELL